MSEPRAARSSVPATRASHTPSVASGFPERVAEWLPVLADLVAERVCARLGVGDSSVGVGDWLTPAEAASRLGVDRSWVYGHAVELGARRLGDGPRARLRIPASAVAPGEASRGSRVEQSGVVEPKPQRRATRRKGTERGFVPIPPRREAS